MLNQPEKKTGKTKKKKKLAKSSKPAGGKILKKTKALEYKTHHKQQSKKNTRDYPGPTLFVLIQQVIVFFTHQKLSVVIF